MQTSIPDLATLRLEVKELVADIAQAQGFDSAALHEEMPLFAGGLELDSIDLLEIVVTLEKKFGMKIRNDASGRDAMQTIASLADAIHAHLNATKVN